MSDNDYSGSHFGKYGIQVKGNSGVQISFLGNKLGSIVVESKPALSSGLV